MGLGDRLERLERRLRPARPCPQHPGGRIALVAPGQAFVPERCPRCHEDADYLARIDLTVVRPEADDGWPGDVPDESRNGHEPGDGG
jgi:hypothetical protein